METKPSGRSRQRRQISQLFVSCIYLGGLQLGGEISLCKSLESRWVLVGEVVGP